MHVEAGRNLSFVVSSALRKERNFHQQILVEKSAEGMRAMNVIQYKKVKIRKRHMCTGCCDYLEVGSIVVRETIVDSGEIYSIYLCDICEKVLSEYGSAEDLRNILKHEHDQKQRVGNRVPIH